MVTGAVPAYTLAHARKEHGNVNRERLLPFALALVVAGVVGTLAYHHWWGNGSTGSALVVYGNVDLREVQLAFMVQDRITALHVEEGAVVSKGQLLGELDRVRFASSVAKLEAELEEARQKLVELERGSRPQEIRKAKADVAAAQADLGDAEVTYRRLQRLVSEQAASVQALDDARGNLGAMRARLKAAEEALSLVEEGPRVEEIAAARANTQALEASLVRARKDLQDTRLLAPAAGIIRSRILEPGDIAGPAKPVFTLAKLDPVWIRTYIAETELGRVAPGMAAVVTTDSFPDKTYRGWLGYISPSAEFTPKNVETPALRTRLVYQAWVYVCNPGNELRLGMPATVTIDLASGAGGQESPRCGDSRDD
jgi:HlyD family secretion protein